MSAVAGLLRLDEQAVSAPAITRMTTSMAHRGPDGHGQWVGRRVALGHLLLHTTPESLREQQPVIDRTRGTPLVLVADARVDNRDELLRIFRIEQKQHPATSDAALLVLAYRKWGRAAPEHILGDFAFAVWDAARRRLFCARDPMGVKPLYYYHRPGHLFAFASEIRALLALGDIPAELNEEKVGDYLLGTIDRTSTFYRGIERLPAAHTLTLEGDAVLQCRRYWTLDPERALHLGSDAAYAEGFADRFTEAVRCRTRCAFPVGAALSGGLDSSSIAVTARDCLAGAGGSEPLHTFSAIFPGLPPEVLPAIDERPYIEAVLATGGFRPHRIRADGRSPLSDLDEMLWHEEDILRMLNLYIGWALYGSARAQGVRVFLDGVDGDSTVSHGFSLLSELARQGAWERFEQETRQLAGRSGGRPDAYLRHYAYPHLSALAQKGRWVAFARSARTLHRRFGTPPWPLVRQLVLAPRVPGPVRAVRRLLPGHQAPPAASLVRPDFARRSGALARHQVFMEEGPDTAETAREAHRRDLLAPLYQHVLELTDKASAAFGLETRYPFFDRRLMEYCVALPAEQKLHGGWTRIVLRRAMEGRLPPDVQWRVHKANLSPNFNLQLLKDGRATLEGILLSKGSAVERYVDMDAARQAYRRYAAAPLRHAEDAMAVYSVVMLELWLRRRGAT